MSGLYSQCETICPLSTPARRESPGGLAFAIDGARRARPWRPLPPEGAGLPVCRAVLRQSPICEIVDTTQAQCHGARAPHRRARPIITALPPESAGKQPNSKRWGGAAPLYAGKGKLRPGVQPLPVRDGLSHPARRIARGAAPFRQSAVRHRTAPREPFPMSPSSLNGGRFRQPPNIHRLGVCAKRASDPYLIPPSTAPRVTIPSGALFASASREWPSGPFRPLRGLHEYMDGAEGRFMRAPQIHPGHQPDEERRRAGRPRPHDV